MPGESRKWMIIVATVWIQTFTGTNFDFSAYSTALKSVLGISQLQLNYLAVASDLGKAFGWSSGLAIKRFPAWLVLFIAAGLGIVGYGVQWLVIEKVITLPYSLVFGMCLLAGLSICWFNTICFVLCIRNFPTNRALALALTVSFNGLSPAIYDLAVHSVSDTNSTTSLYLLLNAFLPLFTAVLTCLPIIRQPPLTKPAASTVTTPPAAAAADSIVFLLLNFLAVLIGIFLIIADSMSFDDVSSYRILLTIALVLLAIPLVVPGVVYAKRWARRAINNSLRLESSRFNLVSVEELELHKELLSGGGAADVRSGHEESGVAHVEVLEKGIMSGDKWWWNLRKVDVLEMLGEEHDVFKLIKRVDFWLYYVGYFCGGTVGLVYSNNVGQMLQSLGGGTNATQLVSFYSICSFFGRLLSAAPDFFRGKVYFARSGWFAMALLPTPFAFFLLAATGNTMALYVATALIGSSSGFIFAAAVSVTSELFGVNSFGVNHNILISNIPIGSILYGSIAALIYDFNGSSSSEDGSVLCMGSECYTLTFLIWGCISLVGLACSFLLFIRTKRAYDLFERTRRRMDVDILSINGSN